LFYRLKMLSVIATAGSVALSSPALACMAPPPPFNPAVQHSDLVLLGSVSNDVRSGRDYRDAQVAVRRVVAGTYDHKTYAIDHFLFDGSGMCALGPIPKKGDRLVVYLRRTKSRETGLQGFLLLRDAAKVDRRLPQTEAR